MKNRITFLILVLCATNVFTQDMYLQCGELFDSENGKFLSERTIVVSANKIKSIEKGFLTGTVSDIVVDLRSKTVLPGFIDMHVHIESESSPTRYLERFTQNDVDVAFQSTVYAERTLMAGFTAVRD